MKRLLLAALALLGISAAPFPPVDDRLIQSDVLPQRLSEFGLVMGRHIHPAARPYTLSTPLFTDYALKERWLYLPPGTQLTWPGDGLPDFPVGSVLVKTFAYPADMRAPDKDVRKLETRLLIHRADGWVALPYVWLPDGSDAVLKRAGQRMDVRWTHSDGTPRSISYAVPNVNQCKGCHDSGGKLTPIGPKARNIAAGLSVPGTVSPVPDWTDRAVPIDRRARAYLDANCAHCHNPKGPADTSGLWLHWEQASGPNLGLFKRPVAAGRGSGLHEFDIDPGHPERSILISRMQSLDPGVAMPELGRATVHDEAVALLSDWIRAMPVAHTGKGEAR